MQCPAFRAKSRAARRPPPGSRQRSPGPALPTPGSGCPNHDPVAAPDFSAADIREGNRPRPWSRTKRAASGRKRQSLRRDVAIFRFSTSLSGSTGKLNRFVFLPKKIFPPSFSYPSVQVRAKPVRSAHVTPTVTGSCPKTSSAPVSMAAMTPTEAALSKWPRLALIATTTAKRDSGTSETPDYRKGRPRPAFLPCFWRCCARTDGASTCSKA